MSNTKYFGTSPKGAFTIGMEAIDKGDMHTAIGSYKIILKAMSKNTVKNFTTRLLSGRSVDEAIIMWRDLYRERTDESSHPSVRAFYGLLTAFVVKYTPQDLISILVEAFARSIQGETRKSLFHEDQGKIYYDLIEVCEAFGMTRGEALEYLQAI